MCENLPYSNLHVSVQKYPYMQKYQPWSYSSFFNQLCLYEHISILYNPNYSMYIYAIKTQLKNIYVIQNVVKKIQNVDFVNRLFDKIDIT